MTNQSNSGIKSYRDLHVWQRAVELVEETYRISADFPSDERFGLTSQIRRATVSIPSNISEGYGRRRKAQYMHHLDIANGSLAEVETQLIIAGRLGFIDKEKAKKAWSLAQDTGKMLTGLLRSLDLKTSD
ncbi:MAG: four helix bundle protein [Phycisphaeraceae bacterium]